MTKSRTEQYFVSLFGVSSVPAAAEKAADLLRADIAPDPNSLPVDVFKLAEAKRLRIRQDLKGDGCTEGMLIPRRDDYLVRLRRDVASARKRFSLAHELGHTFFYKDEGGGFRHAIGIMDRTEHVAEERVCDQFAAFLLMPTDELQKCFVGPAKCHPADFLERLDSASELFSVSKEALARHAEAVSLDIPPCLVLQSRFRPNPRAHDEIDLRTDWCVAIGNWKRRRHVWSHHRLSSVGLTSACELYDKWHASRAKGTFTFDSRNELVLGATDPQIRIESVTVSVNTSGKWKTATESYASVSCLYTWDRTERETESYVVTVLTPVTTNSWL